MIVNIFDAVDDNFDRLKAILDTVETISIMSLTNGKTSIGRTITDVFVEIKAEE